MMHLRNRLELQLKLELVVLVTERLALERVVLRLVPEPVLRRLAELNTYL